MKNQVKRVIQKRLGIQDQTGALTYLVAPLTGRHLRRADCRLMEQRIQDRLESWHANALSMMDRMMLVRSILSTIPVYLLANTIVLSSCLRWLEHFF